MVESGIRLILMGRSGSASAWVSLHSSCTRKLPVGGRSCSIAIEAAVGIRLCAAPVSPCAIERKKVMPPADVGDDEEHVEP